MFLSSLQRIKEKLELPGDQQIMFCSFKQDIDSVLNCEEGRQTLRDVGIKTPSEVGDWLVEALTENFDQIKLAEELNQFLRPHQQDSPSRIRPKRPRPYSSTHSLNRPPFRGSDQGI